MPPVQALAALHLFWLVLIVLPAAMALRSLSPLALQFLGAVLTAGGIMALGVLVGRDLMGWYATVAEEHKVYLAQRCLYTVATMADVPLCQVTLAGLVFWLVSRYRRVRTSPKREAATVAPLVEIPRPSG